jgi:hypothetical protein
MSFCRVKGLQREMHTVVDTTGCIAGDPERIAWSTLSV